MTSEAQIITYSGNPSSGTYLLGFKGEWTDPPIPIITNQVAQATAITDALCALSTVGAGNIVVTRQTGGSLWDVLFQGALADQDVPLLEVDYGGINRGTITISTATEGYLPGRSSLMDTLAASEATNAAASAVLVEEQLAAVEEKRAVMDGNPAVPAEKRCL